MTLKDKERKREREKKSRTWIEKERVKTGFLCCVLERNYDTIILGRHNLRLSAHEAGCSLRAPLPLCRDWKRERERGGKKGLNLWPLRPICTRDDDEREADEVVYSAQVTLSLSLPLHRVNFTDIHPNSKDK